MYSSVQKKANSEAVVQNKDSEASASFEDNRDDTIQRQELQSLADNSPRNDRAYQLKAMSDANADNQDTPIQKQEKPNNTGLPDNLKSGIENLSGYSMDDVKVHRNSDKPAELGAHAYAHGSDIHLASGQEKHLPHEAWHVVQQKQGRVKPTMQMKGKAKINDDAGLEKEADAMGAKAIKNIKEQKSTNTVFLNQNSNKSSDSQLILQAFSLKPYMNYEIRNYISNKNIINKGWNEDKINQLVDWCKSEKQFNSYINNLTYKQWLILNSDFSGDKLPNKIKESWICYQKAKMETVIYKDFKGFKGSGGVNWGKGKSRSDWSGCYIGTTEKQSYGYIGELGAKTGKASMWEISLKKPLPVKVFLGGFLDQPDISGEFKAVVLKEILGIKNPEKLIEKLGGKGFAYLGSETGDSKELVVPWDLVSEYLNYRRIKEYDVNENYEIVSEREL